MKVSLSFHLLTFALILAFSGLGESASDYGFTLELVHRDSPRSPYYNPADTPHQRMANAIRRSISRANRLDRSSAGAPKTPSTTLVRYDWVYLMNISLGTPRVTILGIADTGSNLIWTQCKPCKDCFEQASPLFDPSKSSTYKKVPCRTSQCEVISGTSCGGGARLCEYSYSYKDQSYTQGYLATETITLWSTSGRPVSFPKLVFGCGHRSRFTYKIHADGIVGLGGGNASLVTQLGTATGGKFSYCLVPHSSNEKTSKLNFGANAVVAGRGTVSTRLIQKEEKTHYYLTLEAVSVGKTRVEFNSGSSPSADEGNIIIDSGTTLTYLPQDFYNKIEVAVVKQVKLIRRSCPPRSPGLCYRATTVDGLGIPTVTFHFKGADVELSPETTFVPVADGIIQFSLAPGNPSIYGNLAQTNYLIGYDIQNMKLSFKRVDCTLH